MHSRGTLRRMHSQPPVEDILAEVAADFRRFIDVGKISRCQRTSRSLSMSGIGFGKTQEQNLELLAKLDKIVHEFENYPMLVGASRKSFIGKILGDASAAGTG